MNILKTLPPNVVGRDFVIGDLHGAYSRLVQFMEYIHFNPAADRIISVGDLIDRGPNSEACIALLKEPWFHAVKGNHELMLEQYALGGEFGRYWGRNGGYWGLSKSNEYLTEYATLIAKLPLVITVNQEDGSKFHVLHAELSMCPDNEINDDTLADPENIKDIATIETSNGDQILWARILFGGFYGSNITQDSIDRFNETNEKFNITKCFGSNCSPIFSGHTIVKQALKIGPQTNLDTGAFASYNSSDWGFNDGNLWCGLTIVEPKTNRYWLVNDNGVNETGVATV